MQNSEFMLLDKQRREEVVGQILEWIQKGGLTIMIPLVALFIIGVAFAIERFIALAKAKINTAEFLTKIRAALRNKNVAEAVKICETFKGPIASILKTGLMKYGSPKGRNRKNYGKCGDARNRSSRKRSSGSFNDFQPRTHHRVLGYGYRDDRVIRRTVQIE